MTDSVLAGGSSRSRWWPWRWEWLGWVLAVFFLVAGVPLFLRMPPWCDLTLYDMAARMIMTGGVHYRDVFDTNLPGFVWLLVGIRRVFGPSTEAVRMIDLLIVLATVLILMRLAYRGGATRPALAWFAAGAAAFYPFTTEFCHGQRDVWMFLPVIAAVALRIRRARAIDTVPPSRGQSFWRSFMEGLLWGVAVWIKPHVVIPAVGVWLFSARRLTVDGRWRSTRWDLFGNLLAGSLLGVAGVSWLILTGTWVYFVEVFTRWNPYYTEYVFAEIGWRALYHPFYFVPWTFLQPLAGFLAVCDLAAARWGGRDGPPPRWLSRVPRWWYQPAATADQRFLRAMLGMLLWVWVFQSLVLQRQFPYAHVAETLLTFAIFAIHRWAVIPFGFVYLICSSAFFVSCERNPALLVATDRVEKYLPWLWEYIPRHPLAKSRRMAVWPECWQALEGAAADRRQDRLALLEESFASITVEEANEVAAWLRAQGATADTVTCWHNSPHAAYLGLPGRPAFRFMHTETPLIRRPTYRWMRQELLQDALPKSRYVVSDLYRLYSGAGPDDFDRLRTTGPDLLPLGLPSVARMMFPCNQPAVFRSANGHGRYVVHELRWPVEPVEYDFEKFDMWKQRGPLKRANE